MIKHSQHQLRLGAGMLLILGLGLGCKQEEAEQNQAEKMDGRQKIMVSDLPLYVEVVQTDEERMRGLMFREKLPEDQGMLFVFEESRIQTFWMRNTFIELDIAFIDADGKIISIQRMEPLNEDKTYDSPLPVPYVLEVNAGWFERHGVEVGEVVQF